MLSLSRADLDYNVIEKDTGEKYAAAGVVQQFHDLEATFPLLLCVRPRTNSPRHRESVEHARDVTGGVRRSEMRPLPLRPWPS